MQKNLAGGPSPWIVKEAFPFIAIGVLLTSAWFAFGWNQAGFVFALLTIGVALFFRNPPRILPTVPGFIVSPADGLVVYAGPQKNAPEGMEDSQQISIFLSVFDVHVNRYPVTGKVVKTKHNPGKYLAAFKEKASTDNEQHLTVLETPEGDSVAVIQIAGLIARRIVCYAQEQSEVTMGERMGLIRFGSRVDLFLPSHHTLLVSRGHRVRNGESLVAENAKERK